MDSFGSLLIVFLYLVLFVQLDQCVRYQEQILSDVAVVFDVHRAFTEMSCFSHFSLRLASYYIYM